MVFKFLGVLRKKKDGVVEGGSYFLKITLKLIVTVYAMLKHHSTHNIVH